MKLPNSFLSDDEPNPFEGRGGIAETSWLIIMDFYERLRSETGVAAERIVEQISGNMRILISELGEDGASDVLLAIHNSSLSFHGLLPLHRLVVAIDERGRIDESSVEAPEPQRAEETIVSLEDWKPRPMTLFDEIFDLAIDQVKNGSPKIYADIETRFRELIQEVNEPSLMHALEEALADSPERTLLLEIAKKVTKPTQPQRADEALVPLEDWEERQEKLFDDMCNIAGQYLSGESLQGKSALRMKAEALCRLLLDQMDRRSVLHVMADVLGDSAEYDLLRGIAEELTGTTPGNSADQKTDCVAFEKWDQNHQRLFNKMLDDVHTYVKGDVSDVRRTSLSKTINIRIATFITHYGELSLRETVDMFRISPSVESEIVQRIDEHTGAEPTTPNSKGASEGEWPPVHSADMTEGPTLPEIRISADDPQEPIPFDNWPVDNQGRYRNLMSYIFRELGDGQQEPTLIEERELERRLDALFKGQGRQSVEYVINNPPYEDFINASAFLATFVADLQGDAATDKDFSQEIISFFSWPEDMQQAHWSVVKILGEVKDGDEIRLSEFQQSEIDPLLLALIETMGMHNLQREFDRAVSDRSRAAIQFIKKYAMDLQGGAAEESSDERNTANVIPLSQWSPVDQKWWRHLIIRIQPKASKVVTRQIPEIVQRLIEKRPQADLAAAIEDADESMQARLRELLLNDAPTEDVFAGWSDSQLGLWGELMQLQRSDVVDSQRDIVNRALHIFLRLLVNLSRQQILTALETLDDEELRNSLCSALGNTKSEFEED